MFAGAPKAPKPAPIGGLFWDAPLPQIPACAFSCARSLIDLFCTAGAGVELLLADPLDPKDIAQRSSKFPLDLAPVAAGFAPAPAVPIPGVDREGAAEGVMAGVITEEPNIGFCG